MIDYGMNPQQALDQRRFCIEDNGTVAIEEGIPDEVVHKLKVNTHNRNCSLPSLCVSLCVHACAKIRVPFAEIVYINGYRKWATR